MAKSLAKKLALAVIAALVTVAHGQEDCTKERFEAVPGLTIQAERCDGQLRVSTKGAEHGTNVRGQAVTSTTWGFGEAKQNFYPMLTVTQLDSGLRFISESVLGAVTDDLKTAIQKAHPDFTIERDERTAWGSVDWLPARTMKFVKRHDGTRAIIPEIYTARTILDLRHNRFYVLRTHGWDTAHPAEMWMETLRVAH